MIKNLDPQFFHIHIKAYSHIKAQLYMIISVWTHHGTCSILRGGDFKNKQTTKQLFEQENNCSNFLDFKTFV